VGGLAIPWDIGEASADDTEGGGSEMGVLVLASTVRSREVLVAAASSSMEAGLLKQHWIPWAASTCCSRLQAVLRVSEQRAQVNHRGSA
jgi:hypothetical protein